MSNASLFENTPVSQKVIFLPQCLRSTECKAKTTEDGIICVNCGKCGIGPFKKEAESIGYKIFIAPGSSLIKNILKKYKFKAALGVACEPELKEGIKMMKKNNIAVLTVTLLKDGCVNTEVDWEKVRQVLNEKN